MVRVHVPHRTARWLRGLTLAVFFTASLGCDGDALEDFGPLLDLSVCAPNAGPFSLEIDNAFFPLPVGRQWILEGRDDDEDLLVHITVFDETEEVAGVTTRVIEEREWENGDLIEVSRNFFAQAPDGTVCYFGEDVDDYENGRVVSHDGAWRADGATNRPGIAMPANPAVGVAYKMESAPGVAEDEAKVKARGETVTVPAGTFTDTIRVTEQNPIDKDKDDKVYARGVGIVIDASIPLVSMTDGAPRR